MPTDLGNLHLEIRANAENLTGELKRAERGAANFIQRIEKQNRTMGESGDRARLYRLRLRGVSDSTYAAAKAAVEQKEALRAQQKAMRKGFAITKKNETAAERYAQEIDDLHDVLRRGAISQKTYNRAVRRAKDSYRKASPKTLIRSLGRAVPVVGAAAAGFAYLATTQIDSAAATVRFSRTVGDSVQNISALELAARRAGLQVEDFRDQLREVVQRGQEAALRGGEAAEGFAGLGINLQRFIRMAPSRQFLMVAQSLSRVENSTKRLALAAEVGGDEFVRILPLLRRLSKQNLSGLVSQAEKLGGAINDTDATNVISAKRAIDSLEASVAAASRRIVVELTPAIENAAKSLGQLNEAAVRDVGSMVSGVSRLVYQAVNAIRKTIFGVLSLIARMGQGVAKVFELIPGLDGSGSAALGGYARGLEQEVKRIRNLSYGVSNEDKVKQTRKAYQRTIPAARGVTDAVRNQKEEVDKVGESLLGIRKEYRALGQTDKHNRLSSLIDMGATRRQVEYASRMLDALAKKREKLDLAKEGKQLTKSLRTPGEVFRDTTKNLNKLFDAGAIKAETFRRAVAEARDALRGSPPNINKVKREGTFRSVELQDIRVGGFARVENKDDRARRQRDILIDLLRENVRNTGTLNDTI